MTAAGRSITELLHHFNFDLTVLGSDDLQTSLQEATVVSKPALTLHSYQLA